MEITRTYEIESQADLEKMVEYEGDTFEGKCITVYVLEEVNTSDEDEMDDYDYDKDGD